jgi:competence ComEA-like helix-hairpin-helix protein
MNVIKVMLLSYMVLCVGLGVPVRINSVSWAAEPETVNLNIAPPEELAKIPGITPELARAIVQYREKSGPFKKPEDLLKIPGMTEDLFKKIAPRVDAKGNVVCPKAIETEEEQETPSLAPSKC